jgi:hypothetical protein
LLALAGGRLDAQGAGHLRLSGSVGPHDIQSTFRVQGPLTNKVTGASLFAATALGMGIGRRLWADVEYRVAFGGDWSFDVISVGLTLRSGARVGRYLRFAIANMAGDDGESCPTTAPQDCPGANGVRRGGVELSLGADYPLGPHFGLGPRFWWLQTVSGLPTYRAIGIGFHLAAF